MMTRLIFISLTLPQIVWDSDNIDRMVWLTLPPGLKP
jgi:hypothetical protein